MFLHPNEWLSEDVTNLDLGSVFGAAGSQGKHSVPHLRQILCDLTRLGVLQQWIVVSDERIIEAPVHFTGTESASLPTAGVTAWSAIRESLDASLSGKLRD